MPACFQLIDKQTGQSEKFTTIDNRICKELLNVVPHDIEYVNGWYDYIGFALACGQTFDNLRGKIQEHINIDDNDNIELAYWLDMLLINNWLDENYTASAWYEVSRR